MCIDGCGMLYDPGVPLENVSCKCGQGYWDVFAASFVPGEAVRKGKAPPRKEYEARKRRELSDEEFEARIRHQWIIHFLDCVVKTRWDQKAAREGRNDGTTRRRALTELDEIIRGDYKSRGTSQALFSPVPVASLVPGGSSSQRPLEMRPHAGNVSQDQAPLAKPSSSSQKLREGTAAARVQYQTLFLPAEDLSWDVLKYHWGKKTYGDWRSLQKHSLNGWPGYLIEAQRTLNMVEIAELKADSQKLAMALQSRRAGDVGVMTSLSSDRPATTDTTAEPGQSRCGGADDDTPSPVIADRS